MPAFSKTLEEAFHRAIAGAKARKHELAKAEHLLLELIDEPDAARLLLACDANLDELRENLVEYLDQHKATLPEGVDATPDAVFQRIIQRAAIHVGSSGRTEVRAANVLVALFAERETRAAEALREQEVTRYDAVNFMVHGIAKNAAYSGENQGLLAPEVEREAVIVEDTQDEERLTEAEWRAKFALEIEGRQANPTLDGNSTQETDEPFVFLSYSNQDREFASSLLSFFTARGASFWWDQSISPGDEWRTSIAEKLDAAAVVLVLWTKNSTASKAVIEEASTAQRQRKLVHARLDDSRIPYGFSETQYVDLRDWDGSEFHPSFQRLLYAVQDRLAVPSLSFATTRIRESTPVEVVAHNGKLAVKDAPANAPAAVSNPIDLEARLDGLRQTIGSMREICADHSAYQLPPTLHHCLHAVHKAATTSPVTWYALDDAKTLLRDCMNDNYAEESWNTVVFNGLTKLVIRIEEVRPLLQPMQIDPNTNMPRPPAPEPIVTEDDTAAVIDIAEQANSALTSEDGQSVVDENTVELMASALHQMRELNHANDKRKLSKFRRNLKKVTYIVGGLVSAIGGGVVVNLLTAPTAAETLLARLKPILESMLQYFL